MNKNQKIAVVGMSCIFPESLNNQDFWRNILERRDFITDVPSSHWLIEDYYDPDPKKESKTYCKRGSFLTDVSFDPVEFGMPPNVVFATDTVQLLSLVAAKNVLADTISFQNNKVSKKNVGIILGIGAGTEQMSDMSAKIQKPVWVKALRENGLPETKIDQICAAITKSYPEWNENTFPGLLGNVVAGRIANKLDVGGINCVVDAACASSLSAVNLAISELKLGFSDMVITGGADAINNFFMYLCFSKTPALSMTGDCRPFSDNADGTILGEGVAMMALRRLEDAEKDGDKIYAVINSVGTSSDGGSKSVYAPVPERQALALRRAYQNLDYNQEDVELIEAHGTGTLAGDAAEFEGLRLAFADSNKKQFCALGSIKAQIGHTKSSAGAAGMFKAILALSNKILPPTIKVDKPNPKFNIQDSPFYLNIETRPWVHTFQKSRKASVSAFGFGGSNFHVTLEEYTGPCKAKRYYHPGTELLLLGATDVSELEQKLKAMLTELETNRIESIAKNSQKNFQSKPSLDQSLKLAILMQDKIKTKVLCEKILKQIKENPTKNFSIRNQVHYSCKPISGKIAFIFAGQGSQYLNMGSNLSLQFEDARKIWDLTTDLHFDTGKSVHNIVFPLPAFDDQTRELQFKELIKTEWAQPAIGCVSLSQLAVLDKLGLKPDCTAGHSYGEIISLFASGVIQNQEEMLLMSRKRGELMSQASRDDGTMTAVFTSAEDLEEYLKAWNSEVTIANVNSPKQTVVAGKLKDINSIEKKLDEIGIKFKRLSVSTAFHSALVSSCAKEYFEFIKNFKFNKQKIPVYSNTSGNLYSSEIPEIVKTLAWQMAKPVLFKKQIETMYDNGVRLFLEIGPGNTLTRFVEECLENKDFAAVAVDGGKKQVGLTAFWDAIATLAINGVKLNFDALWDEFEEFVPFIDESKLSKATIKIKGCNYGKSYPPKNGVAGLPKPNPEIKISDGVSQNISSQNMHSNSVVSLQTRRYLEESNKIGDPQISIENGHQLEILKIMQENVLNAQNAFQQTLAQSHKDFLKTSEQIINQLKDTFVANPKGSDSLSRPAPAMYKQRCSGDLITEIPIYSTNNVQKQNIDSNLASEVRQNSENVHSSQAASLISAQTKDFKPILLNIVSEKTGYPIEMLELDMELESGLGIDSIKRVEILSALQEKMPELKDVETSRLTALNTLGAILDFANETVGIATNASQTTGLTSAAHQEIKNIQAAQANNLVGSQVKDFKPILLNIVSEKTGYPIEMLELDMELESGLGIDSIKRVEILSALQEKMPELKDVETSQLTALNTLGAILDFANGIVSTKVPHSTISHFDPIVQQYQNSSKTISRYILEEYIAPPCGIAMKGLKQFEKIFIIKDNRGVAEILAAKLQTLNINTRVLDQLDENSNAIIYLKGINIFNASEQIQNAIETNYDIFNLASKCAKQFFDIGGMFVTVQDFASNNREWIAGLNAFAKTASLEWQQADVKSISIEAEKLDPENIANLIFNELVFGGPELEIIFKSDGVRVSYQTRIAELQSESHRRLNDGDVIVVTGGARGVTAGCLSALSEKVKLKIAILGRTQLFDDDPYLKSYNGDVDLKKAILQEHTNLGQKISPMDLKNEVVQILANREVKANISTLINNGSTVKYYSVDVCNLIDLTKTIEEIRQEWGVIHGVIHAAGILADKYIHEKTNKQFNKVFTTKVVGFKNLLDATKQDTLTHICCFSSVAGRMGNRGQVDYSMANEILNKVCYAENIRRKGKCLVKSINWGPWDAGMVTPALKKYFESSGIALIPLKLGASIFVEELEDGVSDNVEVIIGGKLENWRKLNLINKQWNILINSQNYAFLTSHSIQGIPVVPVMMVHEICLRIAKSLYPDKPTVVSRNLKVFKGIKVANLKQDGVWITIHCQEKPNSSFVNLDFTLSSLDGVNYYAVTVELQETINITFPRMFYEKSNLDSWDWNKETIYQDKLFHGKDLRIIDELCGISAEGCVGKLQPKSCLDGKDYMWRSDVAILDGGLQLVILWVLHKSGFDSLPAGFDSLQLYQAGLYQNPIICYAKLVKQSASQTIWDLFFANENTNEIIVEIKGLIEQASVNKNIYGLQRE